MSHELPKEELATKSIQLAKTIKNDQKRNACIASIFAFGSKYLEEKNTNNLLEAIKMTDLATLLVRDARQEGRIEIAKNMLLEVLDTRIIEKITGLNLEDIEKLKLEQ